MTRRSLQFQSFTLDIERLRMEGPSGLIDLRPKSFDVLRHLAEHPGRIVSKEELIGAVWPDVTVTDDSLTRCISEVRRAIGDEAQRIIKTIPRRGYLFDSPVSTSLAANLPPQDAAAPRKTFLSLPDRPSIAVLPFANLGGDIEQEYFADGMVDDIIAGLSRIKWLFVIACNSSFAYKGRAIHAKQVGRELGVRYLLEGGVRRSRDRVRVTAQLIEAETGAHLWAERFDRLLDDIFAVQDEIAMRVIGAIEPNLRKVEIERVKRKRPDSFDAYDLVMQALPLVYRNMPADAAAAIPVLQRALALQPDYAIAHASLAWCHHFLFRANLDDRDRVAAVRHARAAAAGGSDDATALAISGLVIYFNERDVTTALSLFDRALALSSSNAVAHSCSAVILAWMGRTGLATERAERAIRLSPFDSLNYLCHDALAISYIQMEQYEAAREAALRAIECNPRFTIPLLLLTAALVGLGRIEEAHVAARQVLAFQPNFTIRGYSATIGASPAFTSLAEAWRAGGLPES